jgi:hypothetical protein
MKDDSIPIDEDRWLKIKPKVLISVIVAIMVLMGSWGAIKFDVILIRRDITEHKQALDRIQVQLQTIENDARAAREVSASIDRSAHEAALKVQSAQDLINQKLDFLTGDKRGPRPATGSDSH